MHKKLKFTRSLASIFPIASQSVQGGMLMGFGDIVAQKFVEKKPLDWIRILQYTGVGTFFVTPSVSFWYRTLEKYFGSCSFQSVAKKVALDQIIFAPIFIAIFMSVLYLVQAHTIDETKAKLSSDYKDIVINNYKLWPAVQLANFYFVPLEYQVIVAQSVSVLWNTYLSWKMNRQTDN